MMVMVIFCVCVYLIRVAASGMGLARSIAGHCRLKTRLKLFILSLLLLGTEPADDQFDLPNAHMSRLLKSSCTEKN